MQIIRKSPISGKVNTLEIAVTPEQIYAWQNGNGLIQEIMPDLTDDEREFIMTGITAEEWDAAFSDED